MTVPDGHPNSLVRRREGPYCAASQADLPASGVAGGNIGDRADTMLPAWPDGSGPKAVTEPGTWSVTIQDDTEREASRGPAGRQLTTAGTFEIPAGPLGGPRRWHRVLGPLLRCFRSCWCWNRCWDFFSPRLHPIGGHAQRDRALPPHRSRQRRWANRERLEHRRGDRHCVVERHPADAKHRVRLQLGMGSPRASC